MNDEFWKLPEARREALRRECEALGPVAEQNRRRASEAAEQACADSVGPLPPVPVVYGHRVSVSLNDAMDGVAMDDTSRQAERQFDLATERLRKAAAGCSDDSRSTPLSAVDMHACSNSIGYNSYTEFGSTWYSESRIISAPRGPDEFPNDVPYPKHCGLVCDLDDAHDRLIYNILMRTFEQLQQRLGKVGQLPGRDAVFVLFVYASDTSDADDPDAASAIVVQLAAAAGRSGNHAADQLFVKLDWDGARPLRALELQGRICRFSTKDLVRPGKKWRSPINRQSFGELRCLCADELAVAVLHSCDTLHDSVRI